MTYLSGKDEIICCNIDGLIMFIKQIIETKIKIICFDDVIVTGSYNCLSECVS